jgi:hypothetical protein
VQIITPAEALAFAHDASKAIRALNRATYPADRCPGLRYPADAYDLLGSLHKLAYRLPAPHADRRVPATPAATGLDHD